MLDQPELAREAARLFDYWTDPGSAFRVELDEHGRLRWVGADTTVTREPEASWLRRLISRVIGLFPIESQM